MTTISELPETSAAAAAAGTVPVPVRVCAYDELIAGRGVAVLLPGGDQAAVFRTFGGHLHAVGNLDPATGAQVVSRGLTSSRDGTATVASPLLKHVYELATGRCVDGPTGAEPALALTTFPVFCDNGVVYVLDDPAHHDGGNP
jgi:nitrite reductase (NADH) small subunit